MYKLNVTLSGVSGSLFKVSYVNGGDSFTIVLTNSCP